jgi:Putative capsular polysaccharide synthesis protein
MSALGKLTMGVVRRVPPLQYWWSRQRAARDARLLDPGASGKPPVLVYQMAKVGSETVARSLQQADPERPVFHVHFLSPDMLSDAGALHAQSKGHFGLPYDMHLGRALAERIQALGRSLHVQIVTLVRDPIAREVSGLFQTPEFAPIALRDRHGHYDVERTLDFLENTLSAADACHYVHNWFDRELRATFGIDVFDAPFPKEQGWTVLRNERARALVLRMEDLDRTLGPALAAFLGLDAEPQMISRNVRSERPEGGDYRAVLAALRLPRHVCERIYSHRFSRHFYSDAMLAEFTKRWSAPA